MIIIIIIIIKKKKKKKKKIKIKKKKLKIKIKILKIFYINLLNEYIYLLHYLFLIINKYVKLNIIELYYNNNKFIKY